MFYCTSCANKLKYPESISRSYGKCELCGTEALCFDAPSSMIDKFLADPDSGSHRTRR